MNEELLIMQLMQQDGMSMADAKALVDRARDDISLFDTLEGMFDDVEDFFGG